MFEHECNALGRVDGMFFVLKSIYFSKEKFPNQELQDWVNDFCNFPRELF